jgi:hypothetical protein
VDCPDGDFVGRAVHWTESEIEGLCRGLNAIDVVVLGVEEGRRGHG